MSERKKLFCGWAATLVGAALLIYGLVGLTLFFIGV